MAWPRNKKPRSSALPGTREHRGVQVTVTPVPDADSAPKARHNTGISGTRHTVVDTVVNLQPASPRGTRSRYVDSGKDGYAPTAEIDAVPYPDDDEAADSGIGILPGMAAEEERADEPRQPQPELNPLITQEPPRPVGSELLAGSKMAGEREPPTAPLPPTESDVESQPGTFGGPMSASGAAAESGAAPERVRDLALDWRLRLWRWRIAVMIVVGLVFGIVFKSWPIGLSLAILAGIIDTIYRSRTVGQIPHGGSVSRAQRRTTRQLSRMRRAGYLTLQARPIPDSPEVIDHLVVGPTGVYAIDSERWRRELSIRTWNGRQLWHGPENKKVRLEHARWEAQQASDRLSAKLGTDIVVRPAMAVYGPRVPWTIVTIKDVDVGSGPHLRLYMRRRAKMKDLPKLSPETVRTIYNAAGTVLPGVAPTRTKAPVG
jgi:Nuclease-related domain